MKMGFIVGFVSSRFFFHGNSGNDPHTMMLQDVVDQERQAARIVMEAARETADQAIEQTILDRIRYLKQHCTCWFICTGKK